MIDGFVLSGVGLLIAGTGFFLWMKKRKFDRTNPAGVEQFPRFGRKLAAVSADKVLAIMSIVSLSAGTLILAQRFEDTWGWIVLLPVYAALLLLVL